MLGGKWNANSGSEGRKMGRAEWREEGTIKRRCFGGNPPAANLGPPARRHARKRRRRRGRTFLIYSDKVVLSFVRSRLPLSRLSLRQNRNKVPRQNFPAGRGRPRPYIRRTAKERTAPISLPRSLNIIRPFAVPCPLQLLGLVRQTEKENSRGKGSSPPRLALPPFFLRAAV